MAITELPRIAHPWRPVLEGTLATTAFDTVHEIADAIERLPPSELLGLKGDASAALLLARCGRAEAVAKLDAALSNLAAQPATVSLFSGICGVLWILHEWSGDEEVDAIIESLETALLGHLDVPRWEERHDLIGGLVGVGLYAAEHRGGRATEIGRLALSHLAAAAIFDEHGATWRTPPRFLHEVRRARFPDGVIDLGVAHGVPGIIGMLARLVEAGIDPARSRPLLRSAVDWLLRAVPDDQPRFGVHWPGDPDEVKRIAWCYGDAGVAGILLRASRALRSLELQDQALDLLRRIIEPLSTRPIADAGFCHGVAGLAHIYNLAFQQTGAPDMRAQAGAWLAEILRRRRPGSGIAGYASLKSDQGAPRWVADASLLSGVVGTALVLLAAVEDRPPTWQALFLL